MLCDKFALGLFDNPYVREDPIEIRTLAGAGSDLSQRLATESVTLLKNENGLLPLSRDLANIAVIGPHADSTAVGFPAYTHPTELQMLLGLFRGAETSMAGADANAALPPREAIAVMQAEVQDLLDVDLEDYIKSSYPAVSMAEAVRRLLSGAEVTVVAGTGLLPSQPTDIPAAVAAAEEADVTILYVGGKSGWLGSDLTGFRSGRGSRPGW